MIWYIDDLDQITIRFSNLIQDYYVPKFRISMVVDGDELILHWNDRERGGGGDQRELRIDYRDVADGYEGYASNPSSATRLMADIEEMILSGFDPITDYDRDAQAFIDAIQVLNTLEQEAVNDLFVYWKAQNIFTKLIAVYPFMGGTSVTAKWNMVNPADTDAAFRLVYTGSPTFNSNGISLNGTTQYANTFITPTTHLTQNSTTLYFSKRNDSNAGVEVGSEAPASSGHLLAARQIGNYYNIMYDFPGGTQTAASASAIGRWGGTRTSNIVQKTFKDNVQLGATNTTPSAGWSNLNYTLLIGASNQSGTPGNLCQSELDMVVIADGLSDSEYSALDNSIVTFKAAIGR